MNDFRYKLDLSSKKYICPKCNKKRFVRYLDTMSQELLPIEFGRCDREVECQYFNDPYTSGYAEEILKNEQGKENNLNKNWMPKFIDKPQPKQETVFFNFEVFKKTLSNYDKNIFIQNLVKNIPFPFTAEQVTKVIELYRLGTISKGYRAGAVTFPFIDKLNNIRTVQVKQFDKENHTKSTDFLHSILEKHFKKSDIDLPEWLSQYLNQDSRVSCLFGEHLINRYPDKVIALVEAPKTAIYGSLYFPQYLWLAVYNKSSYSYQKIKVLSGRKILVFPDLSKDGNTFKEWEEKSLKFEKSIKDTRFIVSDLLEELAPKKDKDKGNDIADFLIKLDWKKFSFDDAKTETPPDTEKYDPDYIEWLTEALIYENRKFGLKPDDE